MLAVARYGVEMNISKRQGTLAAAGLLLFAMVVAGVWWLVGARPPGKVAALETITSHPPASAQDLQALFTCPLQPAVSAAGDKDGQFPLQPDLAGLSAHEMASFLVIGKEAASAGRPRDAEVAFIMSCRVASQFRGAASVEAADAKYQLASHYAKLAQNQETRLAAGTRTERLWRAQLLYADSLNTYRAKFGEAHEKSQFAAEGLAAVRQTLAQAQIAAPLPDKVVAVPAFGQPPGSEPPAVAVAKAIPPISAVRPRSAVATTNQTVPRTGPGFDCHKARSIPEKMVCSDAELAQLDRELGRVYVRAKNATPDRAAFLRQQNQEWLRRESTCRDRDCLLRWYAQRRDQLMNAIEGRKQSAITGRPDSLAPVQPAPDLAA